ncbi:aryl-sulfate sulfotransferase [Engelhardtia mirabilis]|uniref:Arylsulfotransferase (ASST) n=1 Tax=Engelhardtia mirabilis TaxID=2528011 RepID=A0A518BNF3_9BACT|nr:Arylsulfotransferase (ASST) [Planctomycetes bacterium Pla133]QDV02812.1 Arylsulfotransferase (ASST) [Planctomycetes bacterium Pla86]
MLSQLFVAAALIQAPAAPQARATQPVRRGLLTKAEGAEGGYTLIAPLRSTTTWLLDADGEPVHTWTSDAPPGQSVYLLENGHLLRCERVDSDVFSGGGQGGRVREYDWDGELVWEYVCADDTRLQHHDVEPLPNGNLLVIAWELRTEEQALAAGRSPQLLPAERLWPDMVLEIEPNPPSGGKVVWEWHAWDHLIQDRDPELPHFGEVAAHPGRIDVNISTREPEATPEELEQQERLARLGYVDPGPAAATDDGGPPGRGADWLHCNAIDYSPELDMIVLSSRELSELWFIDHSTTTDEARGSEGGRWGRGGDLLLRLGNPRWSGAEGERTLFGQHDAQWIPAGLPGAGNILVFNNGEDGVRESSTVDELKVTFGEPGQTPLVETVARYASPDYSSHISGAQRLEGGNTLICAGESGRVVEVTPGGEVVWEYLNPHGGDVELGGPGGPGGRTGPGAGGPHPGRPPRDGGPGGRPGRGPGPGGDGKSLFRATRIPAGYAGLSRLGS